MSAIKSILSIRISWLLQILFLLFGILVVLYYHRTHSGSSPPAGGEAKAPAEQSAASRDIAAAEAGNAAAASSSVRIEKAVICLDVDEGKPLLAKETFSRRVDHLFCYTSLGSGTSQTITHRWIYNDRLLHEKTFEPFEGTPFVASKMEMSELWQGSWRVEIAISEQVVRTLTFELE